MSSNDRKAKSKRHPVEAHSEYWVVKWFHGLPGREDEQEGLAIAMERAARYIRSISIGGMYAHDVLVRWNEVVGM